MDEPRLDSEPSTTWLITTESGKQYVDVTVATLPLQTVIDMFDNYVNPCEPFYVQRITVGGFMRLRRSMLQPKSMQLYFGDGRKFHSDGKVTI